MNIETKFNIGDAIYFIGNKKCVASTVRCLEIYVKASSTNVVYLCNKEPNQNVNIKVDECDAFKSKDELVKSL